MKADLHAHTRASDGADSPAELVAAAVAAGLDLLALTDHDTFRAIAETGALAEAAGLALLPGAELTCVTAGGVKLHLLAYAPSPDDVVLAEQMARVRDDRVPRARRIIRRLHEEGGFAVTDEQVWAIAGGAASVGRPHIAQALVDTGGASSVQDAFDRLLGDGGPFYEPHHAMPVLEAIGWVREAGGAPVFAHALARKRGPVVSERDFDQMVEAGLAGVEVDHDDHSEHDRAWLRSFAHALARKRGPIVSERDFEQMVEAGLAGVEVDHVDHSEDDRAWLRSFAAAHDLLQTGSSDYHGARKEGLLLGAHTTAEDQVERLLAEVGLTLRTLPAAARRYEGAA